MKVHRHSVIAAVMSLIALLSPEEVRCENAARPPRNITCGDKALYHLLRLEGRPVTLQGILSAMPGEGTRYSMRDLRDGGFRLGIKLHGVRIISRHQLSRRPAIVFFDRKPHGHFVVMRTVGHTDTLVQIIDGEQADEIVDYASLVQNPEWTGVALIPDSPPFWRWGAVGLAGSLFIGSWILRRAQK